MRWPPVGLCSRSGRPGSFPCGHPSRHTSLLRCGPLPPARRGAEAASEERPRCGACATAGPAQTRGNVGPFPRQRSLVSSILVRGCPRGAAQLWCGHVNCRFVGAGATGAAPEAAPEPRQGCLGLAGRCCWLSGFRGHGEGHSEVGSSAEKAFEKVAKRRVSVLLVTSKYTRQGHVRTEIFSKSCIF